MTLSSKEITSLLAEVPWERGVVQKVFELDPYTVVFQIRVPGQTLNLLWSATLGASRVHLVSAKPKQPPHPSGFTMACRKYLVGRFSGPEFHAGEQSDRVVTWRFSNASLIAEIGKHAALCVVDENRRVLAHTPNPPTRVHAGEVYLGPQPWPTERDTDRFFGDHNRAETLYADHLSDHQLREEKRVLKKSLTSARKSLKRKHSRLEKDLEKCVEADSFQKWGTLLQQAYGKVARGSEFVVVKDYYDPGLNEVSIPINPARSLQWNIDRYFHQYKRLTSAFDRVDGRLRQVQAELDDAISALEALETVQSLPELETIRRKVAKNGWIRERTSRSKRGETPAKLPYRIFTSQRGVAIWVGRGAKHNDALSTKHTRGKDVWMHAKDWAGAHVVLKTTLDKATSEDLLDAAVLAAHFSKGVSDTAVEVTYTEGKHVRKPKGAAPGLVTVSGGKTLTVRPDDARLEVLMAGK